MQKLSRDLVNRISHALNIIHNPVMAWIVFALSLVLTVAAYNIASKQVMARAKERFLFRASEIRQAIQDRQLHYEQALRGGVALFYASNTVTRREWHRYVDSININESLPGIQGLGYAIPVSATEKEAHIAKIRAEGFPSYTIRPEFERDTYSAIVFLEPFDWRNQRAFGYDMWSNEIRREAMKRARDTGQAATTGIITLVQETDKNPQKGFLTYLPVYRGDKIPATYQDRLQNFEGWIYAPFRASNLMEGILGVSDKKISFEIYDGTTISQDSLLFDSDGDLTLTQKNYDPEFTLTENLPLQGRTWTIVFSTPETLFSSGEAKQPVYLLIAALGIDFLLFYVIVSLHYLNRKEQLFSQTVKSEYETSQASLAEQVKLVERAKIEAQLFFELAPDAFFVVTPQGVILKANKRAHELFEYEYACLPGLNIDELVPVEHRENHKHLRANFFKSPSQRQMAGDKALVGVKKGGGSFAASINLVPIEFKNEIHVVATVHDVSVQKKIERSLAKAKENAESASRTKSEFVANMSHEIRTPLNAVLGAAQLLKKTKLTNEQVKFLNMISSSGQALQGIINDILDFSKIEAGFMELAQIKFGLDEVLSRLAVMMAVNAGDKVVELVIKVAPDVPRILKGDPLRLQQVLINLASNAVKFTESGEVIVSVESVKQQGRLFTLKFSVKDTGIGMSREQQNRLFRAFTQADTSITRKFGGTGLGLVISHKIVELMGSKIELTSEPNVGSLFSFSTDFFAFKMQDAHKLNSATTRTALIIDDSVESQLSLMYIFQSWGWKASSFDSWQAAVKHFESLADNIAYDVALIDSDIVGSDAVEVLQKLREHGLFAGCPAVLMTNSSFRSNFTDANVDQLFKAILGKPITSSTLFNVVHEATRATKGDGENTHLKSERPFRLQLGGVQILLVEDNLLNQTIACGLLEDMGADVAVANNGQDGVDELRRNSKNYDIVLMDIQMPVLDGISATHLIRHELNLSIPIIAMTAGVLKSEQQKCKVAGMNGFIAKPIDGAEMLNVIGKYVVAKPIVMERADDFDKMVDTEQVLLGQDNMEISDSMGQAEGQCFDPKNMIDLVKGKPERLNKVISAIKDFVQAGIQPVIEGSEAISLGEIDKAEFVFHSLKGFVCNYGANELRESIQALEIDIGQGKTYSEMSGQIELITNLLNRFNSEAKNWLLHLPQANQDVQIIDTTPEKNIDIPAVLKESIISASKVNNITKIESELQSLINLGTQGENLAKEIRRMINNYDTDGIIRIMERNSDAT